MFATAARVCYVCDKAGLVPAVSQTLLESVKSFVAGVDKLRGLNLPMLLENMPAFPTNKYAFETSIENISEIIALTGADLLLDIAHARVVASVFGLDVHDYLDGLPLERTGKSTPVDRERRGESVRRTRGAAGEDYQLLEWVLERSEPEVVTLEYFREKQKLCSQLVRIREIIDASN